MWCVGFKRLMPNELLIKVLIEFFFFVFKCSIIGVIMKYVDDKRKCVFA